MFSAVIPIQIAKSPFWNSPDGVECIKKFFIMMNTIKYIDQSIVVTADPLVSDIAEQYRQEVIFSDDIKCSMDFFTFEETEKILKQVVGLHPPPADAFIFLDHRNLCLTRYHIGKAIRTYVQKPETCVIGLGRCEDYACQFRSFLVFKDCFIFLLDETGWNNKKYAADARNTTVKVFEKDSHFIISYQPRHQMKESFFVQAIPFTKMAPMYDKVQEVYIKSANATISIEKKNNEISGFIFIFFQPPKSGSYDTIEMFTPKKGSWELCETGGYNISDKKDGRIMAGRQLFPINYTFSGSLCILGKEQIIENRKKCFVPIIIDPSCIVVDEVDFLSAQIQN
ncbi:uncharacterized protein Dvar_38690 [Desulfosarcina variabilis str. Montpellier]|uniref:hypothetical protein n=1 Tax=Desulfosarcina variabilis TaxID=2300 RepID=UPI003AFA7E52